MGIYDYPEFENEEDNNSCFVCGDKGDRKLFGIWYCHGCLSDFDHDEARDREGRM